ncbi:MAG TPA: RNA polymerase sigma factor, partial [Acidimicrobiales bacterium]|nr:RNA polymerase sigma factor [Acidimicrobiales bacterium]
DPIRMARSFVVLAMVWPSQVERLGDEALLAAVGLGDQAAATAFVRRFQRKVFGLALTVTGDAVLAEDVAQQAFERAWKHAGAFDARRGRVSTWLLTITRNVAIDELRMRRSLPMDPATVSLLLPAAGTADPGDVASTTDQLDRLRGALHALPEPQRRAVLLATIASRTMTEIASIEDVPVPTAKFRVQSGLRKLRDAVRSEAESS